MRPSQERSAFIKRADEKIMPVTVSVDDKGNVRVVDAREPGGNASLWKLVFGDSPPKTPEDKLEFLQDDPDIHKINEDSQRLMCKGCSRTLMFDFPHHINIASWLRHKVTCKVVQKQYEAQYLEGASYQIKQEEDDTPLVQAPAPRIFQIPRAPTRKTLEEERRKKFLENDPLISRVEEDRVWCKPCGKWIGGTAGLYTLVNWRAHRKARHENNQSQVNPRVTGPGPTKATKTPVIATTVRPPGRRTLAPRVNKSQAEEDPKYPTRHSQRKRRRIESEDAFEDETIEAPPTKIIKREDEGPSWLAKVTAGLGQLWSTWLETE